MQLEDIFLARYAELTPDGLFTVVGGGVNRINASGFPWSWGFLFLLARVRLTAEEAKGQHRTAVEREAPDRRVSLSFNFCLVNLVFRRPAFTNTTSRSTRTRLGWPSSSWRG
jgi:hypothetical protein